MANFFAIIDPIADRREAFIKKISSLIAPVPGLTITHCKDHHFQAVWAAHSQATFSYAVDYQGVAIVWGEAIISGTSTKIKAQNLRSHWHNFPQIFDGFHAALLYNSPSNSSASSRPGITISADLLGIFPVYYYTDREIILLASSPELFKYHPRYQAKFNPKGLVGILLTNGLFNGQTLAQGIYRLKAGHCLTIAPEHQPQEIQQYQLPDRDASNPYQNISLTEHLDLLDRALSQTLNHRLQTNQDYSLLLSGGLDSRMLAGFMNRQGIKPTTLTLGDEGDVEMSCAKPVAKYLGLDHHTAPTVVSKYLDCAHLANKWEHLANGANGVAMMGWGTIPYLQQLPPSLVTGLCLDVAFSGTLGKALSFDLFFQRMVNSWGVSPEILQQLLRKEVFGDLVPETVAQIQQVYEGYGTGDYTRNLCFEYYHRQRFHTGSRAWIFSFGASPILPVLDRELLILTALLPAWETYRLAQKELVIKRFPALARLPLDRNDFDTSPLLADQGSRLTKKMSRKWYQWQRYSSKLQAKLGYDRRFYYHILDTNNPGWRAIRQEAESMRAIAGELFNLDILARVLPPASQKLTFPQDSIIESSQLKLLTTFLLWAKDNL